MTAPLYDFRSDNVGGAAPEILEALLAANAGTAAPYGDDDHTRAMNERFAALFERPVRVFPLSSGTGSNSVAPRRSPTRSAQSSATRRRTSTSTSAARPSSLPAPSWWHCRAATTSSSLRR